jgi:hypothetical protein
MVLGLHFSQHGFISLDQRRLEHAAGVPHGALTGGAVRRHRGARLGKLGFGRAECVFRIPTCAGWIAALAVKPMARACLASAASPASSFRTM